MKHYPQISLAMLLAVLCSAGCGGGDVDAPTTNACPNSDTSATVVLRGCDTTVVNKKVGECTIADVLKECDSLPRDEYVRCIARKTSALIEQNVIAGQDKGNIQICAGDDRETEGEQPGEG